MHIFLNSTMTNLLKSSRIDPKPLSNIISTTMHFAVNGVASAMICPIIYEKKSQDLRMEDTDVRFSSQSYTSWCVNLLTGFLLRNVDGRVTTCSTLKQTRHWKKWFRNSHQSIQCIVVGRRPYKHELWQYQSTALAWRNLSIALEGKVDFPTEF